MSNFFELSAKRESCRNFADCGVKPADLRRMVETAALAPSACNSQPWHFTVVTQGELLAPLAETLQGMNMNRFTAKCPAFIVISEGESNVSARMGARLKKQDYASVDIGIATAHLCFAAEELGLATCIIGWFNEEKLKTLLFLPKDRRVRLVLCVGYTKDGEPRKKARKPLDEIVNYME